MKLYEINAEIENCVIVDEETGEVLGIDTERLAQLELLKEDMLQSLALCYKNLSAEAAALKAEKDSFAKRERTAKNKAESIKQYLSAVLGGEKFKTTQVNITYRKSEAVVVDDINIIDEKYLRYAEPTVDKTAVKAAINDGVPVSGVHIEEKQNIQIK